MEGAASDLVVSLIEMSDQAELIFTKEKATVELIQRLRNRGIISHARSHGNYLPALDKAIEIMREDAPNRGSMMLLFLSDGAPSDHTEQKCEHNVQVWKHDKHRPTTAGKFKFLECVSGWPCRTGIITQNFADCKKKIRELGDLFGRDKVVVSTIAFGNPK